MLNEHILKYYIPGPWQEFRDEHLWQQEAHDVLECNLENIANIYAYLQDGKGSTGENAYKKTIGLMTRDTALNLEIVRAHYAYGMSKMTVKVENNPSATYNFNCLKPVEFYEYIGRCAQEKFRHDTDISLAEKIEKTLDLIFPSFGLTRSRPGEDVDSEHSESEDSVDYNEVDTGLTLFKQDLDEEYR